MRYLYIAMAVVFMLGTVTMTSYVSAGDNASGEVSKNVQTEAVEKKAPLADDEEFGEDNRREMPQQENYDENTGMPNVVGSDTNGEMQ